MRSPWIRYPTSHRRGPVQAVDTFGIVPNGGGRRSAVERRQLPQSLSRQEAVAPKGWADLCEPRPRVQHVGGHARGSSTADMNRRRGHSIEPTGTCGRAHIVGTVSVIAGVQGALLPPHRYSQHEVTESFVRFPGSVAFEDMARKRYASSKVLESIRATARLALTPPSANRAPFGAREPNPGAGPRAAPRREIVSSSLSARCDPFGTSLGVPCRRSRPCVSTK